MFYHNRMDVLSMVTLAARISELVHAPRTSARRGVEAYYLGRLFFREGRAAEAIDCFQEALKSSQTLAEWETLKSLSLALKKEKRPDEAASIWMEMIALDGGCELFPYEELSKFYEHHKKDPEEAMKWTRKAMHSLPAITPTQRRTLNHRCERLAGKIKRQESKGPLSALRS